MHIRNMNIHWVGPRSFNKPTVSCCSLYSTAFITVKKYHNYMNITIYVLVPDSINVGKKHSF